MANDLHHQFKWQHHLPTEGQHPQTDGSKRSAINPELVSLADSGSKLADGGM